MLTPQQLQSLPKPLTDIYEELSEFVLRDIARRIAGAAKITDTAEYQLYRARALGMSTEEITEKIAKINGVSEERIAELMLDAAERSNEFDARMLTGNDGSAVPLADNEQLQKLMAAQIKQTNGTCENLTGTLGFAERDANGQVVYSSLTDFLRHQMDMAQMKVATGVTDYNTAIRQACSALAESGLRTVYYTSGRSDRIEVAVRRALMTSVSQITQKISEQNAEEFGADGWEISAHVGARPSHAVYQGRQYPNSQYETIVLPLINDYNCRHSAYPIIMGVTKPSYTEEQLQALDPPFTYKGKQYTAYKAQQQMRKMERYMRRQKDRCITFDAAGDTEAFTTASIKLRRQKDIYEDFCKAAGTFTEYERTFVAGYNRRLGARTGAITRTQNKQKNLQIPLTDLDNGGIIKSKTISDVKNFSEMKSYMSSVYSVSIDNAVESLDFESVREGLVGIEKVIKEFPQAKASFKSVGIGGSGIMCADYGGQICFNPAYYKTRDSAVKASASSFHFHPTGNNVISTGSHEMGHILEKALIDKLSGETPAGLIAWADCTYAKAVVKDACKLAKKLPECRKNSILT